MKHSRHSFRCLGLALPLLAGLSVAGCSDKLLPPDQNSNVQADPGKITLKGDLVLKSPLPADAKVVLIWERHSDLYIHGEGKIDRAKNTFELTMEGDLPIFAVRWTGPSYDSGFAAGIIAVVPGNMQQGTTLDNLDGIYGAVSFKDLLYFKNAPVWWDANRNDCYGWTREFGEGYRIGVGVEASGDRCLHDGFTPGSPEGLKLIISDDLDQWCSFVNWT